ncbi:MAG: DUF4157 domain-containing protein [Actinomycetota bacterium]
MSPQHVVLAPSVHSAPQFGGVFTVQRKCACGGQHEGECNECRDQKISLQPKLAVGSPIDPLEREADELAGRAAGPAGAGKAVSVTDAPAKVQRAGDGGARLQDAPRSVREALGSPGSPLPPRTLSHFESRLGHDFSSVRIHDDEPAHRSARSVDALAYTVGSHIVLSKGRYDPHGAAGKRLLAHELVHVLQQRGPSARMPSAGSSPIQFKRQRGPGGCGWASTLSDMSPIGGLAHVQIQRALTSYRSEVPIPRASKTGVLLGKLGCQPLGTEQGYADLARRKGTTFGFSEIKSLPVAKAGVALAETAHYVLRATQARSRLLKRGSCARWSAGPDDYGFAAILGGVTASTGFGYLNNVISGDRSFGPFLGNPKQVLRAKEVLPGAIGYWCVSAAYERRRKRKEQREKRKAEREKAKQKGKKQPEKPKEPKAKKPKAKPKPKKPSVKAPASGGAANVGFGFSIFSTSVGAGNAGVGISIGSSSAAAGTAGAGISWFSDTAAAASAGAGVSSDSESAGFGVVGIGQSAESVAAAAGAAGAGKSKGTTSAGVGVAGKGETEDSTVAGAGSAGSGKQKDVTGASAGGGKKAQDAQKPGGKDSEVPQEAKEGDDESEVEEEASEGEAGSKGGEGQGGTGDPKGGDKSGAGQKKGGQGDAGGQKGGGQDQGPKEGDQGGDQPAGETEGEGAKPGEGQTGEKGDDQGRTGAGTPTGATTSALGIVSNLPPGASEADREKAAAELAKMAVLLEKASEGQKALLTHLANSSPDSQYLVPASEWIDKFMKATEGISPSDLEYLKSLNWTPGKISAEELRKRVQEALKNKGKPPAESSDETDETKGGAEEGKGKGGGKGDKSGDKRGKGKAGKGGADAKSKAGEQTSPKGQRDMAVDPPAGSKRDVQSDFPFLIVSGMSWRGTYKSGTSYPCTIRVTEPGRTFEIDEVPVTFVSRTDEEVNIKGTPFVLPKFKIHFTKDFWSEKHKFYGRGGPDETNEYEWGRFKKAGK